MKEKVFTFRIQEVTQKNLIPSLSLHAGDRPCVRTIVRYELYYMRRILGFETWWEIPNPCCPAGTYMTLEDAKEAITDRVNDYINNQKFDEAQKEFKNQLGTTVRIVYENSIAVDSQGNTTTV